MINCGMYVSIGGDVHHIGIRGEKMDNQGQITVNAYMAKCEFCGDEFIGFKPKEAELKRNSHMYNDCQVLKCVCIAKDIDYPIIAP